MSKLYIKIPIWPHKSFDSIVRCYNLLSQGPCKDGEWLVLDKTVHLDISLEGSVAKVRFFYESGDSPDSGWDNDHFCVDFWQNFPVGF